MLFITRFQIVILLVFFALSAYSGEVEYTGGAQILKSDVRSSQKSSLNNALLGGIRKYLRQVSPEYGGDITNDHLVFINSYKIVRRELRGNNILTTVRIDIDDIIREEIAGFIAQQTNTAVFLVSGIPDYVKEERVRLTLSALFNDYLFTTKDQALFEQELIDRSNRTDVQSAFQSVSSQYLFEMKFSLKSYKSGESCELTSDSLYASHNDVSKSIPILRTEVTVEDDDPAKCILTGIRLSAETMLAHARKHFISSPGVKLELKQYELRFKGAHELKSINNIIGTLSKRKFLIKSEMTEFFGDEAIFEVSFYFSPAEFAQKVKDANLSNIKRVGYDENSVTVFLDTGDVY